MDLLFDFFPIALFFAAYQFAGIYVATGVAIAASLFQLAYAWYVLKRVKPMLWVSTVIIVVFGGLTLYLNNPAFIKWKPTVLYWVFTLVLLVSAFFLKRNLIRKLLEEQVKLPDILWHRLNLAWAGFFAALGVLNIYVASNFSESIWVKFKVFGCMGLMILFIIPQAVLISRHVKDETPS
ncbi:septation protein A [Uliginosibacterium sp. 31-16]|uniref:septation protein A n=1 Tax=Uliginosibacterium sp. 31-16 TaxID=3068315 RepID=UPI00273FE283|nr:septation protein A [Uliginosibacterium sp. 31-16]MDP5239558.1 septation protein A [Uliginosibacterium sp. 31-16]